MIVVKWFFLILPVVSTLNALAENTPPPANTETRPALQLLDGKQALAKMALAMRTMNYQGTVAFLRDGKLEPMKYSHAANNGHEQEHLLSLNSPLREVVRETGKVSCLYKATQKLVVDHRPFERSFLIELPTDINQLDAVYEIKLAGEESIAMLPAYVVTIKPKDDLRYARKVWLSQQWYLPLKVVVYDQDEEVLEELMFTELEVKDALPFVGLKPANANAALSSENNEEPVSQQMPFVLSVLPKGFKEVFFTRKPMHDLEQPVDHLLLSDGLASVSVYMEHKNAAQPLVNLDSNRVQAIDAVNFFSHTLGDFELTVMGEVPSETIRLIADSVKLRDATR
ncbi:MAG: MucB/RseB C-terminal domain-containing protein [Methylovulum sp.]|uniref:MucB/RseB C-terminal domain-containing protein n=1 Tax=Methylovulum sp. TaxID=1916980 RepID=UPI00262A1C52|nr:MucB/RseB C-terminal domain-containing protein [Methylovulum sp.]MDD2722435.1 MucB/RseB C-terminal domain-containing protein [Methylovulum sp.]MDD5124430.1 MucB/RseB C-terminal domain-containing protein [Methylovulum sp.]